MALKRSNGEGTIYYNKTRKKYECQFFYTDPITGEKKKKKLVDVTKRIVDQRRKKFLEQVEKERAEELANQFKAETVQDWMTEWLETFAKPSVRVKTYEKYRCSIKNHILPSIGNIALDKLTAEDVQGMMNNLQVAKGLAANTINAARRNLKQALEQARRLRKIDYNPVDATKAIKTEQSKIRVLTHPEANKLLESAKGYDQTAYMAILLGLFTGMRIGEIFGLTWANVDFDARLIYVKQSLVSTNHGSRLEPSPKTKAGNRQIGLFKRCLDELRKHRAWQHTQKELWANKYKDNDLVIANPDGGFKDPSRFSYVIFKRLLAMAGIKSSVRFHDLRHTHATWLLEDGFHPKVVSERLGHSSIRITLDTYSHVITGIQKETMKKLDAISEKW